MKPYGLPFRPQSEGWPYPRKAFVGGVFQCSNPLLNSVTKIANTTHLSTDGGSITPPSRINSAVSSCTTVGDSTLNDVSWPCNKYPKIWGYKGSTFKPANQFTSTSEKISYTDCKNIGFNIVQAARQWHGMWPFDVEKETGLPCSGGSKSAFKYTKMRVTLDVNLGSSQVENTYDTSTTPATLIGSQTITTSGAYARDYSCMVDSQSGEVTLSNTLSDNRTRSDIVGGVTTTEPDLGFSYSLGGSAIFPDTTGMWFNWGYDCTTLRFANAAGPTDYEGTIAAITAAIGAWNATQAAPGGNFYGVVSINTLARSGDTIELSLTFTPNTFSYVPSVNRRVDIIGSGTETFHLTIQLSQKNYFGHVTDGSASVFDDCVTLLGSWRFDNQQHFPLFRADNKDTLAPFVTRNEVATEATPYQFLPATVNDYATGWDGTGSPPQRAWFDPSCYVWVFDSGFYEAYGHGELVKIIDGTVIGGPLALGYGEYAATSVFRGCFDFWHENWAGHSAPDSFGSWTPTELPAHTPQWTPDQIVSAAWPCAFASGKLLVGDAGGRPYSLVMQKWCEKELIWPSVNFARPYGADRLLLDYSRATCDGDTLTAPLRYPSAPPFGLVSVSGVYSSGTTTLTLATAATWASDTSWSVDIYNGTFNADGLLVPEATPAASSVTLTKVDATHGKLSGDYHLAKFICPHGMKPWTDDDGTKGDFVTQSWLTDASGTVTHSGPTQNSVPFTPCAGRVLCFSPNGESFPNGVVLPFPASLDPDSTWQGLITQAMPDPFWKNSYHCTDGTLTPDDLTECSVPLVEARATVPNNGGWTGTETAPSLPADAPISLPGQPATGPSCTNPWDIYAFCGLWP